MSLTLRENLNRPLTIEEMDGNFIFLSSSIISGIQGPQGIQGVQGPEGPQGLQGVQGPEGPQGVAGPVGPAGLTWRGSWDPETSYVQDDAVGYSGASWFCISDIPGDIGNNDPQTDTTHWALLAAEGAQGPQGPQGVQGIEGPQGPQGIQGLQGIQGIQGPAGEGLGGTQYILVKADGNDVENANELQAAYNLAKTMSPLITNRITVITAPGKYNFGSSAFIMDTQYIDLVSLDGNRSIIFNSSNSAGTISITANDVFVKGIDVLTKNFTIASNLNLLKVENCKGGNNSFGGSGIVSGAFINCIGGNNSFGGFGTASGIFTNCVGGVESFGTYGIASGTFNSCKGGFESFGSFTTASGNFNNCIGDGASFGYFGIASGTFTNCIGDNESFGFDGTLSGKLYYCRLTSGNFETPTGTGKIVLGIDGNNNVINLP